MELVFEAIISSGPISRAETPCPKFTELRGQGLEELGGSSKFLGLSKYSVQGIH